MVAQLHPRSIKGDGAGFFGYPIDLALGHEDELGLGIDETADEPRTSHAVHVNVRTSYPLHSVLPPL